MWVSQCTKLHRDRFFFSYFDSFCHYSSRTTYSYSFIHSFFTDVTESHQVTASLNNTLKIYYEIKYYYCTPGNTLILLLHMCKNISTVFRSILDHLQGKGFKHWQLLKA